MRNVGFNFVSQTWFAVLAIVTTPYIVTTLGVDSYGIYILVTAVLGYFSFLDLGLGAAIVKYVAEYHAIDDRERVTRVLRTATALYACLGIFGGGAIALVSIFLVDDVLQLDESQKGLAQVAFLIGAAGFLVNLSVQGFAVIPAALQRFDIVVARTIAFGTASILATVGVLALGYGLEQVLVVNLVITTLTAISFYFIARALLPDASFRPGIFPVELRLLTGFGAWKATQRISTRLVFQLDRVVVGAFAPLAAVSYYAVPLSLSQRVTGLVSNVGTAIFPAASALSGQQDDRRVIDLYLRSMKLSALITLPLSSMMFLYAHQIMRYWLNPEFEATSSTTLMILAVANLLFAFTTVPAVTLDATGSVSVTTVFGLVAAGVNLVLVFTLVPTIGYQGAAWAVLANALIMVPMLLIYVHGRVLDIPLRTLFSRSLARPLLAAVVLWPVMVAARELADSLVLVAILCILTAGAYVVLTVILRCYDGRDRAMLRSIARR